MTGGTVSYWFDDVGVPAPSDPLDGDARADVAIVGGGYTGLWTAYYLSRARPDLDIRVLEARFAGFGASGRNGGWLINTITGGHDAYARRFGRDATAAFQRELNATVDEVIRVATAEGIDAEIHQGGSLLVARNRAQLGRLDALARHAEAWPEEGTRRLNATEAAERVRVAGTLGGLWQPHSARIHPARLVTGLAGAVRLGGVRVHEGTRVRRIEPGAAVTDRGTVSARHVIRATEGYTADLAGERRTWVPLNSSMVITEPLPDEAWEWIGWQHFDTLEDLSHVYSYAQRTPDGRVALGGRGKPYRFGSRTDNDGSIARRTAEHLAATIRGWFPMVGDTAITRGWSGVLGVPRNWRSTVGYDATTGLGWAGGYVGTGVAASNLAGRTVTDLVLGEDTALTRLPWANQRTRRWEVEPLRWLGIHGIYAAYTLADRHEARGRSRASPLAHLADVISGR